MCRCKHITVFKGVCGFFFPETKVESLECRLPRLY